MTYSLFFLANTTNPARSNGAVDYGSSEDKKQEETNPEDTNGISNGNNDEEKSSKKDKKRKKKEKLADEDVEELEAVKPTKKSKRKSEGVEVDDSKKTKIDAPKNVVLETMEQSGGTISLYKLTQALEKHCQATAGLEKAPKMLKTIQKQIVVTLQDTSIILNVDQLNQWNTDSTIILHTDSK